MAKQANTEQPDYTSEQLVEMALQVLHGQDALLGGGPSAPPAKRADPVAAQVLATLALVKAVHELQLEMTRLGR
jgi:hypothetical protein